MKQSIIIVLLSCLFFSSCYKVNKPKQPEPLLSEDKMVSILFDMAIMSSAKGINKKKLESNGIVPDEYIYKKHNIDSAIFASNNEYYAFEVEQYKAIYERVKDSLTKLKAHYKSIQGEGKKQKEKKPLKSKIKK